MQYTYSMKNYSPDELADAELMTLINSSQKTRSIFTMKKIMYICVALIAIGWILPDAEPNNAYDIALAKTEKVKKAPKAPTAEELEKKRKGFHCLSSWDGSLIHERPIKNAMRNPKSYKHLQTRITPVRDGKHTATVKYRAENGFGGMTSGFIIATVSNKTCQILDMRSA